MIDWPDYRQNPDEDEDQFLSRMRVKYAAEHAAIVDAGREPVWCWGIGYCHGCEPHWAAELSPKRGGRRCPDCRRRVHNSRKRKSLTEEDERQFRARIEEQGGRCPLCRVTYSDDEHRANAKPTQDHFHNPGETRDSKVGRGPNRDIICWNCNRVLGFVGEDVATLRRMADYLERWNRKLKSVVSS